MQQPLLHDQEDETFARRQRRLAAFNRERIVPGLGDAPECQDVLAAQKFAWEEVAYVEESRRRIAPLVQHVPTDAGGFVAWFERLRDIGPGQGDPLFPWLASTATRDQMCWFLTQEVAGEAGFDDLVAMTQVRMPVRAKLEMARNYWDEMGRGDERGMHGPLLDSLANHLELPRGGEVVPESLALGNMMMALAFNRRYAFHSVGALGAIELTAPTRATYVTEGLKRLGVPKKEVHYFSLHAVLDLKHSDAWNGEVLHSLVEEDPRRAQPIAEGALLRLFCGARCFERYRRHFALTGREARTGLRWDQMPSLAMN